MGLYARCIFLPTHWMVTFEACFYTGFFKINSHIFLLMKIAHKMNDAHIKYQKHSYQHSIFELGILSHSAIDGAFAALRASRSGPRFPDRRRRHGRKIHSDQICSCKTSCCPYQNIPSSHPTQSVLSRRCETMSYPKIELKSFR